MIDLPFRPINYAFYVPSTKGKGKNAKAVRPGVIKGGGKGGRKNSITSVFSPMASPFAGMTAGTTGVSLAVEYSGSINKHGLPGENSLNPGLFLTISEKYHDAEIGRSSRQGGLANIHLRCLIPVNLGAFLDAFGKSIKLELP